MSVCQRVLGRENAWYCSAARRMALASTRMRGYALPHKATYYEILCISGNVLAYGLGAAVALPTCVLN